MKLYIRKSGYTKTYRKVIVIVSRKEGIKVLSLKIVARGTGISYLLPIIIYVNIR